MAIIWQKQSHGNLYQVRTAGASRRLYTNGVCHTQFNPRRMLTGSVWDLLFLPAYFKLSGEIDRVLVLGVGGGSVIRLIDHFLSPKIIEGVELDATHLYLAQRFFCVESKKIHLHQADAEDWLERYSGSGFDLIIEDVFTDKAGQPVRAIAASSSWYQRLQAILSAKGILVMNFASQHEFRQSAAKQSVAVNQAFASFFQLTMPTLDNRVGVYLREPRESADLHQALMKIDMIKRALESKYLRYRIRKQRRL